MNSPYFRTDVTCMECGLTTRDRALMEHHSCDVQTNGGRCEDYPACGHEAGDCNGLLYGSDEAIKDREYERMSTPDYDPYYDDWR